MTELRNTATSRILLPNEVEAFAGERRTFIGRPRGSPASGGLRAGSALPGSMLALDSASLNWALDVQR